MRHGAAVLLAVVVAGACDLTTFQQRVQRPSQIRAAVTDSVDFVAPDTVTLNVDFDVSVTTFGDGCDSKGPTNLLIRPDGSAEFRPQEIVATGDVECTRELRTFFHSTNVRLEVAGPSTITIFGRDADGSAMARIRDVFVK